MNKIEHANIIYMPHISSLGGIETYTYELVKKYKDLDIAVVSKRCDPIQAKRIKKYCKLYIHTNQEIKCKVAIINYDTSIIDYINEDAKIYQTIHGDYTNRERYNYRLPPTHERIIGYIAITKYLEKEIGKLLNTDKMVMSYNPLTIEKKECLTLVSATRLHKEKGKDRVQKLATALDDAGIDYIWYIITGDIGGINSPNVIFIPNRLDVWKWIDKADYVVLLSDSEACSYTLNEALYRNIPIITTPLPYLEEIGVKDGVNSWILDFDCSNLNHIIKNIKNVPKFTFKKLEDNYKNILFNSKSKYQEELSKMYEMKAIRNFSLNDFDKIEIIERANQDNNSYGFIYKDDIFECNTIIMEYLTGDNINKEIVAEIIKEK